MHLREIVRSNSLRSLSRANLLPPFLVTLLHGCLALLFIDQCLEQLHGLGFVLQKTSHVELYLIDMYNIPGAVSVGPGY